ncbi:MAG: PilN domain-containing protein [Armatimonadota bacterium]|nr:PilN domain-containing protein [Armatimonadota bacterium]
MNTETAGVGLGLLPQIDLNEERRQERRQTFTRSRRSGLALAAFLLLAPAILLPWTGQAITLGAQLRATQRQTEAMKTRMASMTAMSSEMDAQISRGTQVLQSRQSRQAWSALLPALAACLPDTVSLEQIQITDREGGADIQMHGAAKTMSGLHTFTGALSRSAFFARLHLDETTESTGAGLTVVNFRMSGPVADASLHPGGPDAP